MLELLFIAIITNAGGEGKTLLSNALAAILRLLGYGAPIILDGDPGNWASSVLNEDARRLGWSVDPNQAAKIVDDFYGRCVILDPGANAFAGSANFPRITRNLCGTFKERGYRALSLHPVSTNKVGALDSMVDLAEDFLNFDQIFMLVNRDGSDHYSGGSDKLSGRKIVRIEQLPPGIIELVAKLGSNIEKAVTDPADGYILAGRYIGNWLANIASNLEAVDALPADSGDTIRSMAEPLPPISFSLRRATDCTDAALAYNIWRTEILTFLNRGRFSRESLLEAAEKFYPAG